MYPTLLKHFLDLGRFYRAPPETVREWQLDRFRAVFHHARKHSRFYRDLYDGASVLDLECTHLSDVRKLPFVNKDLLRSCALKEHLTCNPEGRRFAVHSTSGSTGEPYRIWSRKVEDYTSHIRVFWMLRQAGYHPGKKITMVTRMEAGTRLEVESELSVLAFAQARLGLFRRDIISVYEDPGAILALLAQSPPDVLWSTPSIMELVARRARDTGVRLRIPALFLMSETLPRESRALFKEWISVRVMHNYGLMECPSLAVSLDDPDRFDVLCPSVLVEYRRDEEELGSGVAEVVLTNLMNTTQPFIRYRTGDLVRVSELDSDFPTKTLGPVLGRMDDILTLPSGRELAHHHAYEMFHAFHDCEQYKFVQAADGAVALRLRVRDGVDREGVAREAQVTWKNRFPDDDLIVEFVEEMPLDPRTGKFKNIEKAAI